MSPDHFVDLRTIFSAVRELLDDTGVLVVEVSNIRVGGELRTLAWDVARELATLFEFTGEAIRCNTGREPAGPGYGHSYLLTFTG